LSLIVFLSKQHLSIKVSLTEFGKNRGNFYEKTLRIQHLKSGRVSERILYS